MGNEPTSELIRVTDFALGSLCGRETRLELFCGIGFRRARRSAEPPVPPLTCKPGSAFSQIPTDVFLFESSLLKCAEQHST